MSKLAKKVIDIEKRPKDRAHVVEGVQDERYRKKAKRQANRKEKKLLFQQQNHASIRQEGNNGRDNRGVPRLGRGNQIRYPSVGDRGNGGGNRSALTRADGGWHSYECRSPIQVRDAFRPNTQDLRPNPSTTGAGVTMGNFRLVPKWNGGGFRFKGGEEISKEQEEEEEEDSFPTDRGSSRCANTFGH